MTDSAGALIRSTRYPRRVDVVLANDQLACRGLPAEIVERERPLPWSRTSVRTMATSRRIHRRVRAGCASAHAAEHWRRDLVTVRPPIGAAALTPCPTPAR
jgi:hypothetical protein